MYKIGREVEVDDVGAERGDPLADRPAQRRSSPAPLRCPSTPAKTTAVGGIECLAVGTDDGHRPDRRAAEAASACVAALARRRRASRSTPPRPRSSASRAARPASAPRWARATMPAEAGIVERRGQLHQGLLHRPGDGRPPPLQGQAQSPPARPAARARPAAPGAALRLGEKEVGTAGRRCVSPAHGPIALAIVRREAEPGAELAVGEDGVTARVVDLPFG